MIRKTALLAGAAVALMTAAPAFAQDADTTAAAQTQTPTTEAPAETPAPAQAEASAEAQPLRLTAGSTVTGSDGVVLGQLQGAQTNASGQQELTVRGADGQLRAVPLNGLRQDGEGVIVGWSQAEFNAATPMTPDAGDNASNVSGEAEEPAAAPTPTPTLPAEPAEPEATGESQPDMQPQS